jgi:protein-tyrosine phosphatase
MKNHIDGHDDDRLVPLAGGFNFRDLGGYETIDGLRVRRQVLYRSGKLSALTEADLAQLARKNIQVVCDLRTPQERANEPSLTAFSKTYRSWDYDVGHSLLRDAASAEGATPQHVQDALAATYETMPWLYAQMYRSAFQHIVEGDVPLVFHCAGGKDRTGTLAALILTALGVPEQTVLADYMLTNRTLDVAALAATPRVKGDEEGAAAADAGFSFLRTLSPEMRAPLLTCHPSLLQGALRAVEVRHGSVLAYADAVLGIGADGIVALRQRLLEPALKRTSKK